MDGRQLNWFSFARSSAILAAIPVVCGIGMWISWLGDSAVLRERALSVTAGLATVSAKINAINHWVYRNQGFTKNDEFILVPAFGPTPLQVLRTGGDCGDKSKLVSAMLWQLGIDSGLVQIFPCRDCGPIHAVVEAEYEAGRMVVDPIWDVDYPSRDGKFLGIQELAGTSLGRAHIAELQTRRGALDKIQFMPDAEATFDYAAAVNWQKNTLSRASASALQLLGYDPRHLLRPHFLEDPKLALTLLFLTIAGILIVANLILFLSFRGRIRIFRPSFPPPPSTSLAVGVRDKHG